MMPDLGAGLLAFATLQGWLENFAIAYGIVMLGLGALACFAD